MGSILSLGTILNSALWRLRLSNVESTLTDLGAVAVEDLKDVEDEDLDELAAAGQLKKLELRRL